MTARRPWLLPLTPLYAAGLAWKNRGFSRHPERAQRLLQPVVSVGSLSAGGAGKTPFVIALGEALRCAGYGIDVLSRGHGRASTLSLRVQPGGSADEFGDEPLLIAQRLACPVYVARERLQAGRMAETDRRTTREHRVPLLHLLDDGFQHRQLARAADLVLLTLEDAADMLLPSGNLREPLRSLRRADVIVVRSDEAEALRPVLARVFARKTASPVWTIERASALVEGAPSPRPLAFCGIARPRDFQASLASLGIAPADTIALRDHSRYNAPIISKLLSCAAAAGADGFITTAKDAVKLTAAMRQSLSRVGPLAVTDVVVRIQQEQCCIAELIAIVDRWSAKPRNAGAR